MNIIEHWINGSYVPPGGRTAPVTNPATGKVTGQVALATEEECDAAIAAAKAAFPAWRDTSIARRTQVLFAFRELLNSHKAELAAIITSEHGKVLDDALGEVTRGQEVVEFACGIPHLLKGSYTENASTNVDVHSIRQALGPVAVISPFNFPAMVPMWFFPPRHRRRQHGGSSSQAKKTRRPSIGWRNSGKKPGCRTASSTSCTATRWPSMPCSATRISRPSPSSAPLHRQVRLPDSHGGTESACRPSAEPRTT